MVEAEQFVVTGHRGAMAREPENTMASFERARALGADEIEFDVRLTADGVPVVHHDENLGRVVNGEGPVRTHTWSELSRLRVRGRHRIPTLDDVLALTGIRFQIEIKDARDAESVAARVTSTPELRASALTTSFVPDALEPALAASLRTGLICGPGDTAALRLAADLGVDQLLAHWSVAAHRDARTFADNGGTVTVWPSADARALVRAVSEGYAGTTCDDPGIAAAARELHLA
jgi:glycerophosphoryl diester phosphodiesterase